MAKKFGNMGFDSLRADPNVWMRPAKTKDMFEHYKYILIYVDGIFVVSKRGIEIMRDLLQNRTYIYTLGPIYNQRN